jgi:hypothetical protein
LKHPLFAERDPVEMQGGTTFHFVTDGIESALERETGSTMSTTAVRLAV